MKKFGYLMGAALLTLGSCTNEINEEGFVDKANTISFNAYSNKTRAYTGGDATINVMKTGSFGVVGYKNSDNNLYLGSETKATEQVWNETKKAWDYNNEDEKKYWPSGSMDFFAYFPYSDDGATFASTKTTDSVMTIKSDDGNQDILFSYIKNRTQTDIVHLYFYHALSKIKSVEIQVAAPDIEVSVSNIEILNSYTKGNIKVDNTGVATYSDGTTPRSVGFSPAKTIKSHTTETDRVLFDNTANAYLFATNTTEHDKVKGTGQTMWNGTKDALNGGILSGSNFICMKVTGKVKHHTETNKDEYLVGSADSDGVMYIPLRGNSANSADISEFLAGRRYIYKIVMSSNVGYKDNGDPIMLSYIKFGVNQVYDWSDVIVTINL